MNDFVTPETEAQFARWTKAHSNAAQKQGWNMFDYDSTGLLEIERCNETGTFRTDGEAIDFVKAAAASGDETAKLAIELDDFFQPIIDQVREANRAANPHLR